MDKHLGHAEHIGDRARVLATRATERREHIPGDVVTALNRDLLDRVGHVRHRDLNEPAGHLLAATPVAGGLLDPPRKGGEAVVRDAGVEWLVTAVPEHRREVGRLDAAERDVRIGDGERAAAPVGGWSGIRSRGIRAHAVFAAVEMQDRSAPSGDGVDTQHRRPHADPRHLGFVLAFKLARIV